MLYDSVHIIMCCAFTIFTYSLRIEQPAWFTEWFSLWKIIINKCGRDVCNMSTWLRTKSNEQWHSHGGIIFTEMSTEFQIKIRTMLRAIQCHATHLTYMPRISILLSMLFCGFSCTYAWMHALAYTTEYKALRTLCFNNPKYWLPSSSSSSCM